MDTLNQSIYFYAIKYNDKLNKSIFKKREPLPDGNGSQINQKSILALGCADFSGTDSP